MQMRNDKQKEIPKREVQKFDNIVQILPSHIYEIILNRAWESYQNERNNTSDDNSSSSDIVDEDINANNN